MEIQREEKQDPQAVQLDTLLARADEAGCRKLFEVLGATPFDHYVRPDEYTLVKKD